MNLETALQIAYAVTLLAFGLRDWQMRRRIRTLSGRVRALLDLEHERQDARLSDLAARAGMMAYRPPKILKAPQPSFWDGPFFSRFP